MFPSYFLLKNCCKLDNIFISVLDAKYSGSGIHNGFIVSEKKHPFLKEAIKQIVINVDHKYYGNSALDVTGPNLLSKVILKCTNKSQHNIGYNRNKYLSYYLYQFEYGIYQNIYKGDIKILSKNHSLFLYLYRKLSSKNYNKMWQSKNIYLI